MMNQNEQVSVKKFCNAVGEIHRLLDWYEPVHTCWTGDVWKFPEAGYYSHHFRDESWGQEAPPPGQYKVIDNGEDIFVWFAPKEEGSHPIYCVSKSKLGIPIPIKTSHLTWGGGDRINEAQLGGVTWEWSGVEGDPVLVTGEFDEEIRTVVHGKKSFMGGHVS